MGEGSVGLSPCGEGARLGERPEALNELFRGDSGRAGLGEDWTDVREEGQVVNNSPI